MMTSSQHVYDVRPRKDRRAARVSTIFTSVAAIFTAALVSLNADTTSDEDAVRKLPQTFCDAWAKHDGHELAKMMAEDVDFVTVATVYLHGRADFEKFHVRLLSGRFKDSTITPLETTIHFLHPEMAVVHWSWRIDGDKAFDGTPRPPRLE
jgi:ketosteroid isomerase-like protein